MLLRGARPACEFFSQFGDGVFHLGLGWNGPAFHQRLLHALEIAWEVVKNLEIERRFNKFAAQTKVRF